MSDTISKPLPPILVPPPAAVSEKWWPTMIRGDVFSGHAGFRKQELSDLLAIVAALPNDDQYAVARLIFPERVAYADTMMAGAIQRAERAETELSEARELSEKFRRRAETAEAELAAAVRRTESLTATVAEATKLLWGAEGAGLVTRAVGAVRDFSDLRGVHERMCASKDRELESLRKLAEAETRWEDTEEGSDEERSAASDLVWQGVRHRRAFPLSAAADLPAYLEHPANKMAREAMRGEIGEETSSIKGSRGWTHGAGYRCLRMDGLLRCGYDSGHVGMCRAFPDFGAETIGAVEAAQSAETMIRDLQEQIVKLLGERDLARHRWRLAIDVAATEHAEAATCRKDAEEAAGFLREEIKKQKEVDAEKRLTAYWMSVATRACARADELEALRVAVGPFLFAIAGAVVIPDDGTLEKYWDAENAFHALSAPPVQSPQVSDNIAVDAAVCPDCGGTGEVRTGVFFGGLRAHDARPGTGGVKEWKRPCPKCAGRAARGPFDGRRWVDLQAEARGTDQPPVMPCIEADCSRAALPDGMICQECYERLSAACAAAKVAPQDSEGAPSASPTTPPAVAPEAGDSRLCECGDPSTQESGWCGRGGCSYRGREVYPEFSNAARCLRAVAPESRAMLAHEMIKRWPEVAGPEFESGRREGWSAAIAAVVAWLTRPGFDVNNTTARLLKHGAVAYEKKEPAP